MNIGLSWTRHIRDLRGETSVHVLHCFKDDTIPAFMETPIFHLISHPFSPDFRFYLGTAQLQLSLYDWAIDCNAWNRRCKPQSPWIQVTFQTILSVDTIEISTWLSAKPHWDRNYFVSIISGAILSFPSLSRICPVLIFKKNLPRKVTSPNDAV